MASQPARGFRGFVQKPVGKILLIVLCTLAVAGTFGYVDPLLAIPVFLLLGLALPIMSGLKRPRYLALAGLVVIVATAPIANVAYTNLILTPVAAASSYPGAPDGSGGSLLANASVTPFTGGASDLFTWTVWIDPSHLPTNLTGTNWRNDTLQLFISSCPGAVTKNASYCGSSYTFVVLNHTFAKNLTAPTQVLFNYTIGSNGIWSWQMGLLVQNATGVATQVLLVGDPTYNGIEGPVIGGFAVVYDAFILDIYFLALLYLGLPFYFLLLLYMWLKNRERRRQDYRARAAGSIPPSGTTPGPEGEGAGAKPPEGAGPGEAGAPLSSEAACPSCQAVVYPNETKCWKCGADLKATGALASGPAKETSEAGH